MGATYHNGRYYGGSVPIDDTDTSSEKTWSSEKIAEEILETYSTTETVVGTWIDGKPLYERMFTNLPIPQVTTEGTYVTDYYMHNIPNVALMFLHNTMVIDPNSATKLTRQLPYTLNSGFQLKMAVGQTSFQIVNGSTNFNAMILHTIVRYTKTTD